MNTSTVNQLDRIAAKTKLCMLKRSAWNADKKNDEATEELRRKHNTDAGRVSVHVCDHPALNGAKSILGAVYAKHKKITLPTIQESLRLIPVCKEFDHMTIVREASDEFFPLVNEFMSVYDQEAADAPARLNGLYDASAWPTHEEMAKKFDLKAHYLKCLTDGPWADWLVESARAATDDIRDQLEAAVHRVAEKCAGGRLHATVFTSLRELIDLIPEIDISDSDELMKLAEAARPLAQNEAEELRKADRARNKVKDDASRVLDMFGSGSLA